MDARLYRCRLAGSRPFNQQTPELHGKVKAWANALTGPTSLPGKYPQLMNPPGSETGPGQLVTWGKSTICSVDAFGYKFEWTTNSSKHIPFDWAGP
jgi:hypothetical protein